MIYCIYDASRGLQKQTTGCTSYKAKESLFSISLYAFGGTILKQRSYLFFSGVASQLCEGLFLLGG